jgi:uroporphyrinogen-III synthase
VRVVITRAVEQAPELAQLLRDAGAEVVSYPTITVRPLGGPAVERARRELARGAYDAVLFTSTNAVEHFAPVELGGATAFAVGSATARALAARGITAHTGEATTGAGLARAVLERFGANARGRRFLAPRAREGRPELADELRAAGGEVDVVFVYETVPLTDGPPLPAGPVDWVLFMSPSAVAGFMARATVPPGARVACVGPTTAEAARRAGLRVDVVPAEASSAALVASLAVK